MKILLSPAKKLRTDVGKTIEQTSPLFISESNTLIEILQKKSVVEISALMKLSENLAQLNFDRYQGWDISATPKQTTPAAFTFNGEVYQGLEVESLSATDLEFAQEHLLILSGIYGVLKPLDSMQEYRLEMGTKLNNAKGPNLYHFWSEVIAKEINSQEKELVVNLASNEYFKAVNQKELEAVVVTPIFKDFKIDKYKVISFYAKKARGLMARFIIKNKISDSEGLKRFNSAGYQFSVSESTPHSPVFLRKS